MDIVNETTHNMDIDMDFENQTFDATDVEYIVEELPEIEYYEILTYDEIIIENPTFIALTKKEIFDELYDIFKNANKTNKYVDLFYNILDNSDFNTTNYTLVCECEKKTLNNNENANENLINFINTFKKINKYRDLNLAKKEKDKLFFSIIYDDTSNYVRFKPFYKTSIKFNITSPENNDISDDYTLLHHDDTNVPVKEIYYTVPKAINNDYLSDKVLSYLKKKLSLNKIETTSDNINIELNKSTPSINTIIDNLDSNELKEFENLDYENISILLEKFNYYLDKINLNDFNILNDYIKSVIDTNVVKYNLKSVRIKPHTIINHKITFYNNIFNIFKLLNLSEDDKNAHDAIISKLEEEKNGIDNPDILYDNIYDIIYAISNNNIDLNTVITNIRNIVTIQNINNLITTIKNFNSNDMERIEELYNIEKEKYQKLINSNKNLYSIKSFKFMNLFKEINEIKTENNIDNYYINNDIVFDNNYLVDADNKDDIDEIENIDINYNVYNSNYYDKYINNYSYINANGFKELLKIILPIIGKLEEHSKLTFDFNNLCNKLYASYGGLSTKSFILKESISNIDDTISDTIIENIAKINFNIITDEIFETIKKQISFFTNSNIDTLTNTIIDINNKYIDTLKDFLLNAISICILEIQTNIIDGTHIHNYNNNYIHLWADNGFPINKNKKVGVTIYLVDIFINLINEDEYNIYNFTYKIIDTITNIIETKYKDILADLYNKSITNTSLNINRNKGKNYQIGLVENLNEFKKQKTLAIKDKVLHNYVNSLIYMPGINYNRIHKYLLGCCLQKIDKDFAPDNDLKGKRNDLLTAKKYFSKNRYNNKDIEYTYLPIFDNNDDTFVDDTDSIDFKKIKYEVNYDDDNYTYDNWFNSMQNKYNIIIENNYINIHKNGSEEFLNIIKNYLFYLTKTINNNKSLILNNFINNLKYINYKQLLYNSITITNNYLYNNPDDDVIKTSLDYIKNIITEFKILNNIHESGNKTNIIRAKAYLIVKAICSPFNPDNIINNNMQLYIPSENNTLYINLLKEMHNSTNKIILSSKIPTFQENQNFINKMREEYKNKKLELYDKQTDEQRKVLNELSKIGIDVNTLDFDDTEINQENEYNGENDFLMKGEDDNDFDNLDNENYEHVYH